MSKILNGAVCFLALVLVAQAYPGRRGRNHGWQSGASSRGTSWGDYTSVRTDSGADNNWHSSKAYSRGSGSASGVGLTRVGLESEAGVNGYGGRGRADAKAFGDTASSSAGATASKVSNYNLAVGSSGAAGSVSTGGFGGANTRAEAEDNFGRVSASGRGQGRGDLVVSRSQSEAGLLNSRRSGKASGYSESRGRGNSYSAAGASLRRGGY